MRGNGRENGKLEGSRSIVRRTISVVPIWRCFTRAPSGWRGFADLAIRASGSSGVLWHAISLASSPKSMALQHTGPKSAAFMLSKRLRNGLVWCHHRRTSGCSSRTSPEAVWEIGFGGSKSAFWSRAQRATPFEYCTSDTHLRSCQLYHTGPICYISCYFGSAALVRWLWKRLSSSITLTTSGRRVSAFCEHRTARDPELLRGVPSKKASSPLTPPRLSIPMGMPLSFACLTNLQALYVARLLPTTNIRSDSSTAVSAALLVLSEMFSPNMMTAGFRMAAFDVGSHAPSSSRSIRARSPFGSECSLPALMSDRQVGQAGYRKEP